MILSAKSRTGQGQGQSEAIILKPPLTMAICVDVGSWAMPFRVICGQRSRFCLEGFAYEPNHPV